MSKEQAGGPKTQDDDKDVDRAAIEALLGASMPYFGSIKSQVQMQLALMTGALAGSTLRANSIPPPSVENDAEADPVLIGNRWVVPLRNDRSSYRIAELQEASRMAASSARLIQAYASMRTEFTQNHSVSHVITVDDPKKRKRSITKFVSHLEAPTTHSRRADEDYSQPQENGGSNASG